ncbi:MAG: hypothetical protein WCE46_02530 [Methanoregula sp.]|uniref:hypothetical protein n=1 Tax=Methanoregula sp. TaxID=2052170 RepID=UPI003C708EDA
MADDSVVMQYFAKLGLDVSDFLGGMQSSGDGFLSWYRDITVSLEMTIQLFQQFEQAGMDAFNNTVGAAIKFADQMQHVVDVTGMSAESAQKWNAANIAVGGSLDSMLTSLQYVQGKTADTTTAGENYRKTLDNLHIAYQDQNGDYLDADTLQKNILTSLSNVTDATQRDSDARLIYGRGWASNAELITNAAKALQVYNSTPAPFGDDQIAAAHNMGIEIDQFNAKLSTAQTTIGLELMPATQSWMDLFNGALNTDSPVFTFFQYLNTFLQDAADGLTIMAQDVGIVTDALSGNFSKVKTDFTNQAEWEQSEATKRALLAQGYIQGADQTWDAATGTWKSATSTPVGPSGTPAASLAADKSTAAKNAVASAAKAGSGWDKCPVPYLDIGSDGTLMSQFMWACYQNGLSFDEAMIQWSGNAQFNPTTQAVNQTFMGGQANQGANERAAAAKSGTAGATTTAPTTAKPGTPAETTTVGDETKKQATLYDDLDTSIEKGWGNLEKIGLVHYAAMATMAQDAAQAQLDYMAACVNFGGENPIVQNKIIVDKSGPDWTPPAFTPITAPTLAAADFSNVKLSSGGGISPGSNDKSGSSSGTGSSSKVDISGKITISPSPDSGVVASGVLYQQVVQGG